MTNNPTENTTNTLSAPELREQSKQKLHKFFQQPLVRKSIDVLVPGVLAAALFPIFGPAIAMPAAAVAIHNGLKLIGVSLSITTIDKLLNSLKGKGTEEIDLLDAFQEALPQDKQINGEAAKALVTIAPDIKEAALQNQRLDPKWLAESIATNLKAQGGSMATIAPKAEELFQLNNEEMKEAIRNILANWSHITQTITVSGESEVSTSPQSVKGRGGNISQSISAIDKSKVTGSSQNVDLS